MLEQNSALGFIARLSGRRRRQQQSPGAVYHHPILLSSVSSSLSSSTSLSSKATETPSTTKTSASSAVSTSKALLSKKLLSSIQNKNNKKFNNTESTTVTTRKTNNLNKISDLTNNINNKNVVKITTINNNEDEEEVEDDSFINEEEEDDDDDKDFIVNNNNNNEKLINNNCYCCQRCRGELCSCKLLGLDNLINDININNNNKNNNIINKNDKDDEDNSKYKFINIGDNCWNNTRLKTTNINNNNNDKRPLIIDDNEMMERRKQDKSKIIRRRPPEFVKSYNNNHHSNTTGVFGSFIPGYIATLLLISYGLVGVADACSSRSTPKPRPPQPTPRPNITFHMYTCSGDYAEWYCLNGATCFTVKIVDSLLYNCLCANGYIGQRCEFKDLDGSYLPSRQRVMLETASIAGAVTIAIFLAVITLVSVYIHCKRKQKELRTSSGGVDSVDGISRDPELRPFSSRNRSLMIFMAKNPNSWQTVAPSIEQTRMPMPSWNFPVEARLLTVNETGKPPPRPTSQ